MAADISELVVKIRGEGIEDTTDKLDNQSEKFEEMGETAKEQTGNLEDFSDRWKGAMSVFVAGLAVAAAGLASKMPVLQGVASGLMAIFDSLALRVNDVLSPLNGLTAQLFEVAAAIDEVEGPLGTLLDIGTTLAFALGGLAASAAAVGATLGGGGISGAISAVTTVFSTLAGIVSTVAGAIAGFVSGSLAAAAALGAIIGAITVGILEVTGFMDVIRSLGRLVAEGLPTWFVEGWLAIISIIAGAIAVAGAAIAGFVEGVLRGGLQEGIDQAVQNARDVLDIFAQAWQNTLQRAHRFVAKGINKIITKIESGVNQAINALNRLPGQSFNKVSLGRVSVPSAAGAGAGGGGGGDGGRDAGPGVAGQQAVNAQRQQNAFAGGQDVRIRIEPERLREFISADVDTNVANRGG